MVSVLNSVLCGGLHSTCVVCGLIMKSVLYCTCMCLLRIEQCACVCWTKNSAVACVWTEQYVISVGWVYVCSEVCVPGED